MFPPQRDVTGDSQCGTIQYKPERTGTGSEPAGFAGMPEMLSFAVVDFRTISVVSHRFIQGYGLTAG